MAIKEDVIFNAVFNDAFKDVQNFTKNVGKSINGLQNSFGALGTVAKAAVAVFAGREIVQGINSVIKAASEKEQVIQQLNTALALAGDFSVAASKDIQAFADEIQRTTKFDGDLVTQQVALAKSFGLTNDETKKLVKTATDLAAATGMSLDQAVESLGKTLQGTTGQLGKTIPGLKGLGQEALKTGAAIDFIAQRFGGAAAASLDTFDGAVKQLGFSFGDLQEELGNAIVKNPVVIKAIQLFSEVLQNLASIVTANADTLAEFVGDFTKFALGLLPTAIKGVQLFGFGLQTAFDILIGLTRGLNAFIKSALQFEIVQAIVDGLYRAINFLRIGLAEIARMAGQLIAKLPGLEETGNAIAQTFDELGNSFAEAAVNGIDFQQVDKALESVDVTLGNVQKGAEDLAIKFIGATDNAIDYTKRLSDSLNTVNSKAKESTALFEQLNAAASAGKEVELTIGGAIENVGNFFKNVFDPSVISKALASVNSLSFDGLSTSIKTTFDEFVVSVKNFKLDGFASSVEKQFNDFVVSVRDIKLSDVGEALGKAGSALISGLGTVAQGLAGTFSGGYINQFSDIVSQIGNAPAAFLEAFKNLDGVIAGLLESMPKVIDSLLEQAPKIIKRIIEAIPEMVDQFIKGLSAIADIIAESAPALASALLDGLTKFIDAVPAIIDKLISALPALLRAILAKLPALISAILRAIPQIVGSIARAIPELIVVFLEGLPDIITAFVEGIIVAIPEIVFQLVDAFIVKGGLFKIIIAIIKAIPQIAIALVKGIVGGLSQNLGKVFGDMGKIFSGALKFPSLKIDGGNMEKLRDILSGKALFDKIKNAFNFTPEWIEKLKKILSGGIGGLGGGGGGGGRGAITGIRGSPFAEGGFVPAGFPNDTFPARLTSGEMVITPGDTKRLSKFLDSVDTGRGIGGGASAEEIAALIDSRPVQISVVISEKEFANAMYNARTRGYKV